MNNTVFGKKMENDRKHRDTRFVKTDKRRSYLTSKPNYHPTKQFSENLLAIEVNKAKVEINKPVYLGLPILDISKKVMYEFQYDYIKPKYLGHPQECYVYTDSFIVCIKMKYIYEDIVSDVEKRFEEKKIQIMKLKDCYQ